MNLQHQQFFIAGKIKELQTAILYFHTDSLLKLPTSVVQTLHVDEAGCLWLAINKPVQVINEFDRSFHVALNYYRKGIPFFLNTYGLAKVVADAEETSQLTPVLQEQYNAGKLIICVRILEVNYYEKKSQTGQSFLQKCRHSITSLFGESGDYNHFNFDEKQHYA